MLALPGVLAQFVFPGLADGLAAGLVLFGLAWWMDRRDGWAVAIFCLAAVCREAALVVPLALLLTSGWRRGRVLLLPFGVYAGWVGIVWLRLHALPSDAVQGSVAMPFQGLIEAIPNWSSVVWVAILSLATLGAVAYVRAPDRHVRAVVLVSGAFASTMSVLVWRSGDVVRPLLPLAAIGACLLARKVRSPADDPSAATPVAPFSPESEPVGP